jgi:hypothetical protein
MAKCLLSSRRWFEDSFGKTITNATDLRCAPQRLVAHIARVRVVFYVLSFDVVFQMEQERAWSFYKLQYAHLKHVDLFRWIVSIIRFGPDFCVHLQFDIVEISLPWYVSLNVRLSNIVESVLPVGFVREIRELFEAITSPHCTLNNTVFSEQPEKFNLSLVPLAKDFDSILTTHLSCFHFFFTASYRCRTTFSALYSSIWNSNHGSLSNFVFLYAERQRSRMGFGLVKLVLDGESLSCSANSLVVNEGSKLSVNGNMLQRSSSITSITIKHQLCTAFYLDLEFEV